MKGTSARRTIVRRMVGSLAVIMLFVAFWHISMLWTDDPALIFPGNHSTHRNGTEGGHQRQLHSHNDEMQGGNALSLALDLGFGSIEADCWLQLRKAESGHTSQTVAQGPYEIVVGHKQGDITGRTLKDTYLEPIMTILDQNNANRTANNGTAGLYRDDPSAQVQLLVDMKSDGLEMWPYFLQALQPFIEKGYLTTLNTSSASWHQGPLTIIGTGNTPLPLVYHQSPRFIFYDAPLTQLARPVNIPLTPAGPAATFKWTGEISPLASAKFPVAYHLALFLPKADFFISRLRRFTLEAEKRGIGSRWWGALRKPRMIRWRMWDLQRAGGATWLDADDLEDAAVWDEWHDLRSQEKEAEKELEIDLPQSLPR